MSDKTPIGFVETCYGMGLSLQERCRVLLPQAEVLAPRHFQTGSYAVDIDEHGRIRILAAAGEASA